MSNVASINFKKTKNGQLKHNCRINSPSYLLDKKFRGSNEINKNYKQALELNQQIIHNAKKVYTERTKQKLQARSYRWSAVVNIKSTTTMRELEKLAEHFQTKYGFQCYQIAIHRNEGHIDEHGQPHLNHHAHLEFITLNKDNGKNMMRRAVLKAEHFRQMQTETAKILNMERGVDKRISEVQRIEPRKLGAIASKYIKNKNEIIAEQRVSLEKANLKIKELTDLLEKQKVKEQQANDFSFFR